MYLVVVSSEAHVQLDIILGIAQNKTELLEILWNYTELNLKYFNRSFEEEITQNNINIHIISNEDYSYLNGLYKKYEDDLTKYLYKLDFTPSGVTTNFWYGILETESDDYTFSKKEREKIRRIINRATSLT